MKRNKKPHDPEKTANHHEHPLPGEIDKGQKQANVNAREQAEEDIEGDVEFSAHNKNDDLDEGESARLGENNTGLV